jgi:hypothetical protein
MRTEYRLLDTAALRGELKFWVRPNFVRNRFFRAARAFLDASTGTAMDLDRRFFAVKQVHGNLDQWTWDYLFSPLNTIFARITLRGQLMAGPLVKNMLTHDGTMRLLQLRILLARNDVSDANVEQFLSSQLSLRNPFTEEPMRWDRAKRVIWFKEPGDSISRRQVRLPGGQWLDDNCEEAR